MKIILVAQGNNNEVVPSSQELVDVFNKTAQEYQRMTVEDQDDLNQMFLESGLLEEVIVQ